MTSDVSTQKQLDQILAMLTQQSCTLNETKTLLEANMAKVSQLEHKVLALETKVVSMDKDIMSLKDQLNVKNQDSKLLNVRFFGIPVTQEESKATDGGEAFKKQLYDKFIQPSLNTAKAKGEISSVPHASTSITNFYRVGLPVAGARPPPLVVSFNNKDIRMAVFRHKRNHFPKPTEQECAVGTKRYVMVEDLTPPTYKLLKDLQQHKSVAKAWTIEGRIRFTLSSNPEFVHKVKLAFFTSDQVVNSV